MPLAQHRIVLHGDSPYPHETEAIAFAEAELPNSNPFLVWELVELHDGTSGRLYEIDLLVLGYSALYLVEIKSGPGTYRGDWVDWHREVSGEPTRYMECPYRLTNTKAKVLGSLLQRKLGHRAPWVQPIIFLSHADAKLSLRPDGMREEHGFLRDERAPMVQEGDGITWWTCAGARANQLLARVIEGELGGRCVVRDMSITCREGAGSSVVGLRELVRRLADEGRPSAEDARRFATPAGRARLSKFEPCLPAELLLDLVVERAVDVAAARTTVAGGPLGTR